MNIYQTISSETMEKVQDTFHEDKRKEYMRYYCTWNDIETYWNVPFSMREGYSETEEEEQIPVFFQIVHAKNIEIVEKALKTKSWWSTVRIFDEDKFKCNDLSTPTKIELAFEEARKTTKVSIIHLRNDLYNTLKDLFTEVAPTLSIDVRKQVFFNLVYISGALVEKLNAGHAQVLIDTRYGFCNGNGCFWSIINHLGADLLFFEDENQFYVEAEMDANSVCIDETAVKRITSESRRTSILNWSKVILIFVSTLACIFWGGKFIGDWVAYTIICFIITVFVILGICNESPSDLLYDGEE